MKTRNKTVRTAFTTGTYLAAAALSATTVTSSANAEITLFADNFNRADAIVTSTAGSSSTGDINGDDSGKSGTLGNLQWTTRAYTGDNFGVQNNALRRSGGTAGVNGGLAYLQHNFTDAIIASGGGFSISIDILSYVTTGSGRWWYVGVGQSLADLDGLTADTAMNSAANSPADLLVGYRNTIDDLEIYNNGVLNAAETVTSGLPNPPTTMRIDYVLSDFNAGSTVTYGVFFDDSETAFTTGSFTWQATNQNYIYIGTNLNNAGAVDNFAITAVPEPGSLALLGLGGLLIARRRRS